jgi:hypothetical protein
MFPHKCLFKRLNKYNTGIINENNIIGLYTPKSMHSASLIIYNIKQKNYIGIYYEIWALMKIFKNFQQITIIIFYKDLSIMNLMKSIKIYLT